MIDKENLKNYFEQVVKESKNIAKIYEHSTTLESVLLFATHSAINTFSKTILKAIRKGEFDVKENAIK